MNKFVILDRDGVINKDSDSYIKNLEEWIPEEGSIEAIVRLTKANIPVFVATNQSGIGRGKISRDGIPSNHKIGIIKTSNHRNRWWRVLLPTNRAAFVSQNSRCLAKGTTGDITSTHWKHKITAAVK